jgi:hypothetical protein
MSNLPQNIAQSCLFGVFILVAVVMLCYAPILKGSFKVLYDTDQIVNDDLLNHPERFVQVLTRNFFEPQKSYQPAAALSHMAERFYFHQQAPFYFLTNIFLHLTCVLLVYGLFSSLLKNNIFGLLCAVLFALHPSQWEAVSFLSGRAVLLTALFYLASMGLLLVYLRRLNGWWMLLSLFFFGCGLLSHQAYGLFSLVFISFLVLMNKDGYTHGLRWLFALPYGVMTVILIAVRHSIAGYPVISMGNGKDLVFSILATLRIILMQIGHWIFPVDVYFHQTVQTMTSPADPWAWTAAVLFMALLIGWIVMRKQNIRLSVFLSVWFVIASWPLLIQAFMNTGRIPFDGTATYLASIPLTALFIISLKRVFKNRRLFFPVSICVMMAAVFLTLSIRQNILSTDELALLKYAQKVQPESPVLEYNLGIVSEDRHLFMDAEGYFERAIRLDPNLTSARMGLGKVLYRQGKYEQAATALEDITNPGRYESVRRDNLQVIYSRLTGEYSQKVQENPGDLAARYQLAVICFKGGDAGRAMAEFSNIIAADPQNISGLKEKASQNVQWISRNLTAVSPENK